MQNFLNCGKNERFCSAVLLYSNFCFKTAMQVLFTVVLYKTYGNGFHMKPDALP